jgi:hypothetical protein
MVPIGDRSGAMPWFLILGTWPLRLPNFLSFLKSVRELYQFILDLNNKHIQHHQVVIFSLWPTAKRI